MRTAEVIQQQPLRHYWHPVADASEIHERVPIATTLLGEDLVLYRCSGKLHAMKDLCPHRGSRLSLGSISENCEIICPYHGWTYNANGRCVYIPAQAADQQRIPARAVVNKYQCVEHLGLAWVALEDPATPVPDFPEWSMEGYESTYVGSWTWAASAGRIIENVIDVAHLPIVHPYLLADPTDPTVERYTVEWHEPHLLYFEAKRVEASRGQYCSPGGDLTRQTWVSIPFTWRIRIATAKAINGVFVTVQPISERLSRFWQLAAWSDSDGDSSDLVKFKRLIIEQDRPVVESQRPEALPVDLSEELSLRGADAASLEYRRRLGAIGIGPYA
jgi:phenylpropionate dioxygenase-like ring-hydroxylating dioxygenase large terminal subunit